MSFLLMAPVISSPSMRSTSSESHQVGVELLYTCKDLVLTCSEVRACVETGIWGQQDSKICLFLIPLVVSGELLLHPSLSPLTGRYQQDRVSWLWVTILDVMETTNADRGISSIVTKSGEI